MRVKRLEVEGFKSFKDKTVIHFDQGVTGIVGPNGCGKSNIVDAFFWVMGEQSYKHMRGSKSQDLIFNGSSQFSPSVIAEATLVLETDFVDTKKEPAGATVQDLPIHLRSKEVSVTRRVHRTGEGEYFINSVPARLKDIQELFMDTGVGAKGYSVIEQGQIDKVINAKPEDRRLLIEEAAGIAKYKARKKESLRKMEATEANLSRLRDVLQEIERSLSSLERQAQKARKYKEYREELLDKELTWGRRKLKFYRGRTASATAEKAAVDQELLILRAELQQVENSIETTRLSQLDDTRNAETLQTQIQDWNRSLAREQGALEISRQRQEDLVLQRENLSREKENLQISIETEHGKCSERVIELEQLRQRFQEAQSRVEEMSREVRQERESAEGARQRLESVRSELLSHIQRSTDLTSRSAMLIERIESGRNQLNRVVEQEKELRVRGERSQEEVTLAEKTQVELRSRLETLSARITESRGLIRRTNQELGETEAEQKNASRALTQIRSKLESLEELAAAFEGLGDGPKAVLDWAKESDRFERVSLAADLFEIQPGFDSVLEGWLGGELERLFTDDIPLAFESITRLKENQKGHVAIRVFEKKGAQSSLIEFGTLKDQLEASGMVVLGALTEFVSVNSRTRWFESAHQLIDGVCVVEDLSRVSGALSPIFEKLGGWALVDRSGLSVDTHGIIRGGGSQGERATRLLGRKRVIQEMRVQVEAAESCLIEWDARVSAVRVALETEKSTESELLSEQKNLEIQEAAVTRDVQQYRRTHDDLSKQLSRVVTEKNRVSVEVEESRQEHENAEQEVCELQKSKSEMEARLNADGTDLSRISGELHAREERLNEFKIAEASLKERIQSLERELTTAQIFVQDRKTRLLEVSDFLNRVQDEHSQKAGGDSELQERIEKLTLQIAEKARVLAELKDILNLSASQLNTHMERLKALHREIESKNERMNHLTLELEKVAGEMTHLIQNLEEKYGPGCLERESRQPEQQEMGNPIVTAEMTQEEQQLLEEEVQQLRERIRRLGEVNPMAAEEYDDMRKRFDHLTEEKADLEKSIDNLKEAIEHINRTSEERFRKAFEAISSRFEKLFPIIFGGGRAELSLVYPEGSTDILDCGVDILAQPPGKKVVNISLLSGGEKALTAISLIFAIFMVKPSPFCLLDEVDAPLDDSNIGKFNALLKEMAMNTQFIIITHNKKTMELNDTLYGVTMEDPGVSKMVSIQMQ